MKKHKLLSVILSTALLVTAMPVYAFAAPGDAGSGDVDSGTIGGNTTVGSSALLKVVVPTDLDFIINPLELPVNGDSSQIISTPYTFVNKSNMDVQLSVTPTFTSADGVTIAASPDDITNTAGEDPTIYLELMPTAVKPALTGSGNSLAADVSQITNFASGDGISMPIAVDSEGNGVNSAYFKLKNLKSAYSSDGTNMQYDPDLVTAASTDAIAFKFGGKVSQMSNWKDKDLKVEVKYDFDFITTTTYADSTKDVSGTYGMVSDSLLVTGPGATLNANGQFGVTSIGDWRADTLYYLISENPINISKNDISQAVLNNEPSVGGLSIDRLLLTNHYTYDSVNNEGELVQASKEFVSGKYFLCIIILSKGDETMVVSSNPVLMN